MPKPYEPEFSEGPASTLPGGSVEKDREARRDAAFRSAENAINKTKKAEEEDTNAFFAEDRKEREKIFRAAESARLKKAGGTTNPMQERDLGRDFEEREALFDREPILGPENFGPNVPTSEVRRALEAARKQRLHQSRLQQAIREVGPERAQDLLDARQRRAEQEAAEQMAREKNEDFFGGISFLLGK